MPQGRRRKLIIFTEHRDTLNYLHAQDRAALLGSPDAVVTIHGGAQRDERRKIQELLPQRPGRARPGGHRCRRRGRQPPERQPDGQLRPALEPQPPGAALRAHPPHRPDRGLPPVEPGRQRDPRGRCLPAPAREAGESSAQALGGRVFDILGEVFEETQPQGPAAGGHPLRRRAGGPRPAAQTGRGRTRHRAPQGASSSATPSREDRNDARSASSPSRRRWRRPRPAGCSPTSSAPSSTRRSTGSAANCVQRETGRYEITHVPVNLRERDRVTGVREPVLRKYERVCFDEGSGRARSASPWPALLHPGHPLMQATLDLVLEKHRPC